MLTPRGSLYFHIDYREVHYCKMLLDRIFGRECFLNEIIWAYDYGGKPQHAMARQARQHPVLRQRPRPLYLQRRRDRARPLHGARAGGAGKSRARQAAHRYLVAYHRRHQRQGENRLPDPEAAGGHPPHRAQPRPTRATWCWISSPAAARSGRAASSWGGDFILVDNNPQAIEVMARRFAGLGGGGMGGLARAFEIYLMPGSDRANERILHAEIGCAVRAINMLQLQHLIVVASDCCAGGARTTITPYT